MIKVALRSMANGKFVCAEGAGGQPLIANRDAAQLWETFEVVFLEGGFEPRPPPTPEPIPEPIPNVGSVALVRQIKDALTARGIDLSGPCGALAITNAVAWTLRAGGAGLLFKPSGNNCRERATDIVCYQDGRAFDILGDGGGANTPQWAATGVDDVTGRWRAPTEP